MFVLNNEAVNKKDNKENDGVTRLLESNKKKV